MSEQVKQLDKNRFGIIQLSDLQFGKKHRFEDSTDFIRQLAGDIRNMSKEHAFRPIYMVLSGDISQTGHAEEFKEASKVIGAVCDELKIERKKILCVPGNHDINWNLSDLSAESGDDQVKFLPYNNFVLDITKNKDKQPADCYIRIIEKISKGKSNNQEYVELEFLLLNSCEKEDRDNHDGYVCKEKLLKTMGNEPETQRLKIAIMHHQLFPLASDGNRETIKNSGEIESILVCSNYNIVLTGHTHEGLVRPIKDFEGREVFYAGCGSTGVNKLERKDGVPNQYCIHIFDLDKNIFQSMWRAYFPMRRTSTGLGEWDEDNSFSRKTMVEFSFPDITQKETPKDCPQDEQEVITSENIQETTKETIKQLKTNMILSSKTEREKMKLAILNLLGGWHENG